MAGYTPVFDSVFHGTLCGKWPTLPVWLTILPMADKNGHIDMSYQAMSALTGWPVDLLKQAMAELTAPDPESRSEAEEGRRLVLIDPENRSWGWRVVNHGKYRERARKQSWDAERTASGKDAERKRVSRGTSRDAPTSPAASRLSPLSDTDTDTDTDTDKHTRGVRAAEDVAPSLSPDFGSPTPQASTGTTTGCWPSARSAAGSPPVSRSPIWSPLLPRMGFSRRPPAGSARSTSKPRRASSRRTANGAARSRLPRNLKTPMTA
jgi:hypothetical protein